MKVQPIAAGQEIPALMVEAIPRTGDTVTLPGGEGAVWRVTRVHWPLDAPADPVELHVSRAALDG